MSLPFLAVFSLLSGCQVANVPSQAKLAEHRETVNETGLYYPLSVVPLKANLCPPTGWMTLPLQKQALYTHQQWRSPSRRTAVGITYIRLPLPLSSEALAWFASREATKRAKGGKLIRRWSDDYGREWFEVENEKYHTTGYVMARGLDAWINYTGYRMLEPRMPTEIDLARRALDTVIPAATIPTQTATAAQ